MIQKTLKKIYDEHEGKVSDKWSLYLNEYERLLAPYRRRRVSLLEIGVQNGGSLDIWSKYFENAKKLVGCDIDEKCSLLHYDDKRISVVVGDANIDETEKIIRGESQVFDIIIDDGSHFSSDIVKSFARYFPYLSSGGIFIAEDLHCSYWKRFEGGLFAPHSSVAFFKRLADIVSHEHWGIEKQRQWLLEGFSSTYGIDLDEELLSQIHSVEFINSICVVRKSAATANVLGQRVIAGTNGVIIGIEALRDSNIDKSPQGSNIDKSNEIDNEWAIWGKPPEDELVDRIREIKNLSGELTALGDRLKEQQEAYAELSLRAAEQRRLFAEQRRIISAKVQQISEQGQSISAQAKLISEQSQSISAQVQQISEHSQSISAQAQRISELEQLVAEKDRLVCAYLNTNSWMLTTPYRFIGLRVKRAIKLAPALPGLIAAREGFAGLKRWWIGANLVGPTFKVTPEYDIVEQALVAMPEGNIVDEQALVVTPEGSIADQTVVPPEGDIVETDSYTEWLRRYDSIDDAMRERMRNHLGEMHCRPTISIVMPVYNPKIDWLREAIDSVRNQIYENWQLCIADDCSTDPEVRHVLEEYRKQDKRIHVVFREKNGHISVASNSAIELATGEWIALMDQDDLLPEVALYYVADAIASNPDAGLIYSDEDKLDETGRRYDPYFKSDWNPDLFLSHNMICHLGVYRTDMMKSLGGFRVGYEGSQDYDLALRLTEKLKPSQIVHIPRVLYHWRSHSESTAQAGSNKNYALTAGKKALDEHFKRMRIAAEAELLDFGMYRARYALPDEPPLVSLIIPTRNGLALIRQCLESILENTTYPNYEIIVVDNNSDDPATLAYFEEIARNDRIRVLRDERPFNYSALNNRAVENARGEYIGLINNDIEVISPEWLSEMVTLAIQPGVGAVGACLWYPNDTLQHGGVIVGLGGVAGHSHKHLPRRHPGYFYRARLIQTLSAVTAACLVVRKSIYLEVGGLDEENLKIAFNDVDFCLTLRQVGYRNVWTPYAELYHHESASRGYEDTPEKEARFMGEIRFMRERWATARYDDPAYSLNLTLDREDFSLAWPPRRANP